MANPLKCVSYITGVPGTGREGREVAYGRRKRTGGCIWQKVINIMI